MSFLDVRLSLAISLVATNFLWTPATYGTVPPTYGNGEIRISVDQEMTQISSKELLKRANRLESEVISFLIENGTKNVKDKTLEGSGFFSGLMTSGNFHLEGSTYLSSLNLQSYTLNSTFPSARVKKLYKQVLAKIGMYSTQQIDQTVLDFKGAVENELAQEDAFHSFFDQRQTLIRRILGELQSRYVDGKLSDKEKEAFVFLALQANNTSVTINTSVFERDVPVTVEYVRSGFLDLKSPKLFLLIDGHIATHENGCVIFSSFVMSALECDFVVVSSQIPLH